jgi:hypothetical protein
MAFAGQTPTIIVLKEGMHPPLLCIKTNRLSTRISAHDKANPRGCWIQSGTDASQGRGQMLSNINACLAVQDTVKSTLGPYGGDLLIVDANGKQTITNDGATVMKVSILSAFSPVISSTRITSNC